MQEKIENCYTFLKLVSDSKGTMEVSQLFFFHAPFDGFFSFKEFMVA